ncbi:MAG: RHS repeat domain-containing protein [Kiritimatiellia bacterium]
MTSSVNSDTTTYTANALNQYSQISVLSVPSVDNLVYDLDGNLLTNGVWSYAYDAENRLIAAYSNNVCIVSNAYDHMSRRVVKWTPCHTTTFVYDGWNLVQETISTASGTTTNHYVWGKDLSGTMQDSGGVGGLLAVQLSGSWYFPFYDNKGNVMAYVDEGGAVVAEYVYDAFGATVAKSGSMADVFTYRFSTKHFDSETCFYYYGYRFYDPIMHRWLNRDSIEEEGGLNLYAFCGNDGNQVDLLGLQKCPCTVESFELTVKGWTGAWPNFLGVYSKQLVVKFKLKLKAPATKADCVIEQYMLGETKTKGSPHDKFEEWEADRPSWPTAPFWHPTTGWGISGGKWNREGRVATWEDGPGFLGLREKDFPVYYGGVGGFGRFQFKTQVRDWAPAHVVSELTWGLLIDFSTPKSGRFYFYL